MALVAPTLQEALLSVMDRKDHWAWSHFEGGWATPAQLLEHYRQEYEVYVRDFPVLLARIHARCPHPEVRRELAENLFEEETGKLSLGVPHPELFLVMMEGLEFARGDFQRVTLLPEAREYRSWIDRVTKRRPWIEGAAVVTIFIEGSIHDRSRIQDLGPRPADLEAGLADCFLARHYGVDPEHLALKRAHGMVEDGHRHAAWKMVLEHATQRGAARRLVEVLERTLELWERYRDGVARACGIHPRFPQAGASEGVRRRPAGKI